MKSPHIVRKKTNPTAAPPEAGIHWINTLTNEEFFSVGTESTSDWISRRRSGFQGYTLTVTENDVINKYIILPYPPLDTSSVIVTPGGGIPQINGIDYQIIGDRLYWGDMGLDGFIEKDDVLMVQH